MTPTDLTVHRDGDIAVLTLARPEVRNALRPRTYPELAEAVRGCADARCLVITGQDPGFCAGDDVRELLASPEAAQQIIAHRSLTPAAEALLHTEVPVIAAVNGPAVGWGMELALMADLRVLSEKAVFASGFVRMGLIPDVTGLGRLAQLVGRERAAELLLTGRRVDASEAIDIGLAARLVDHDKLMPTAIELARQIADQPPLATRAIKVGLRRALDPEWPALAHYTTTVLSALMDSDDHREAVTAFAEKRTPRFRGR